MTGASSTQTARAVPGGERRNPREALVRQVPESYHPSLVLCVALQRFWTALSRLFEPARSATGCPASTQQQLPPGILESAREATRMQHDDAQAESPIPSSPSFSPLAGEPNPFRPGPGWHLGPGRLVPLTGFPDEAGLAGAVLARLEPWFHVAREVRGQHPLGAACRIDAVVAPREPLRWKRDDVALAIEFKSLGSREAWGRTDLTAWVAQAIDYTYVEWGLWGRLPIFMCPSPLDGIDRLSEGPVQPVENFVHGLLGQFNVGFLCLYEGTGLSFVLQGRHRIWSERYGVESGRRWSLRSRIGNRH